MAFALTLVALAIIWDGTTVPIRSVVDQSSLAVLSTVGLFGLVVPSDTGNAIARLTEKIERFDAGGDDVDFSSDRDDELGDLANAIDSMVETVRESERRLERQLGHTNDVLDAIDDVFYVLDGDGNVQRWNERLPAMTGYSNDEIESMHVLEFYEGDDEELIQAAMERAQETGSARVEADVQTADGDFVPHEFTAVDLEDPDGNPVLAGIGRDVRERKHLERELQTEKEHFRVALENSPMVAFRMDTDLRYTWIGNPHPKFRRDDVLGKRDDELLPPAAAETLMAPKRTVLATGEGVREEVTYELSGSVVTYDLTVEPLRDDSGEIVGLSCSSLDITDRKEYERALSSIHEASHELLHTATASDVAELIVETTEDILDVTGVGIYRLSNDVSRLEPIASTAGFGDRDGDPPSVPIGDSDSIVWNTFVGGTQTVFDDTEPNEHPQLFDEPVDGGFFVPISESGVFVVLAPPSTIDDETRKLVETLAATTEATFDRLESEASLREQDAELEERNDRLERQIQITEIIRTVNQSLVSATTREEIERTVCERLVANDDIAFAWIGSLDASETTLQPHSWAGTNQDYLNAVSLETTETPREPSVRTARTERATVVTNVLEDLKTDAWRKHALAAGFSSCLAVPIRVDKYSYGVLSVYATEPGVFDDLERTVFEELGESIANSITAVKTRQALQADTLLELTLRFDGAETFLARVARNASCQVEYEGVTAYSVDETRLFFSTIGGDPDEISDYLAGSVSVRSHALVNESGDRCLFEAAITGRVIASKLVRHGARPRSIRATETGLEAVVDVPPTSNVREFVGMLSEQYPSVELVARRDVKRTMHTREELVTSLVAELTPRQLEVMKTAYYAGFFEWPRESTGEDIAELLGVSQPTVNRHLRFGQQRLLGQLFGSDNRTIVE
ncbi:bacterio-opsin activator domain-containing protein [Natronorubrum aibiense]|uniref:bacterio-opsin activator domain-containing protein n=1 Tax=Natronorubrum aibiense TaxID=348826 RepID=UPI0013869138|nr:bacterio-opsin activator domain-containing protein [Natronorubrum aibiense]